MKKILLSLLMLSLFLMPLVLAEIDFDTELSEDEQDQVDAILEPVMKIYATVKYTATVIGVMMLVFAGVLFTTAGGDNSQKEKAKQMAAGGVIGLIIIWVAPLVV